MAVTPPVCDFDWPAPDFSLPGTDGKTYTLADVKGPNGTLVMFICNHCPYVLSVLDRILRDAKELQAMGVGVVAISANDVEAYPQDSFENMIKPLSSSRVNTSSPNTTSGLPSPLTSTTATRATSSPSTIWYGLKVPSPMFSSQY